METLKFKLSDSEISTLRELEITPWDDFRLCNMKVYEKTGSFFTDGIAISLRGVFFYIDAILYTDERTDTTDATMAIISQENIKKSIIQNGPDKSLLRRMEGYDSIRHFSGFDSNFLTAPKKISIINEIMYCHSYFYSDLIRVDADNALLIEAEGRKLLLTASTSENIWIETENQFIEDRMKYYDGIRGV